MTSERDGFKLYECAYQSFSYKRERERELWLLSQEGGGCSPQTFPGPMRSYPVKENLIGSAVSEILRNRQKNLLLYIIGLKIGQTKEIIGCFTLTYTVLIALTLRLLTLDILILK